MNPRDDQRRRDDARRERVLVLVREVAGDGDGTADPDARLSDVGLDSLAFAELAAAAREQLGVDLAPLHVDGSERVADVVGAALAAPADDGLRALSRGVGTLQRTAAVVGGWALRWWCSLDVEGRAHLPSEGPAVLAMNHESALDIPLVVAASPRRITFMAKRELFGGRGVSVALRGLGAFAVDRDRFDLRAVDTSLEVLRRGGVLGMYPEGTRAPGLLLPFLPGAAWLALRTGAPARALLDLGHRAR